MPTYGTTDDRPHSRACGIHTHEHGDECARDCPTCHGRAIEPTRPLVTSTPPVKVRHGVNLQPEPGEPLTLGHLAGLLRAAERNGLHPDTVVHGIIHTGQRDDTRLLGLRIEWEG